MNGRQKEKDKASSVKKVPTAGARLKFDILGFGAMQIQTARNNDK